MGKVLAVLLLIGAVIVYWKWIVAVAVIVALIKWGPRYVQRWQASRDARLSTERARVTGLCARADEQHAWAMQGDPRGVYGSYPPAC